MNKETSITPATKSGLAVVPASDFAETKLSMPLLRQVVIGLQANQHRSTADAMTRGEVSGGGRKPWRQKGTGRARVGSSRTPVWRGGGIVFGPSTAKNYHQILTSAMKRQAVLTALGIKAKAGQLHLAAISAPAVRTKEAIAQIPEIISMPRVLLVVPDRSYILAFRNLRNVRVVVGSEVNALDLANRGDVIFINDTYTQLKERVSKAK